MPGHGTLAITARGCGSRWYGRVSIPADVAKAARLSAGTRVSARCEGGIIIIQADDQGRIRFPEARGKQFPRHAFEAATRTLGLKEIRLTQASAVTEISEGEVRLKVPDECLAGEDQKPARPRRTKPRRERIMPDPADMGEAARRYGSAAAITLEAARSGRRVRAMTLPEVVSLLGDLGVTVDVQGPRYFRLDGESANASDLVERANRLSGSTDHDRIVLIMD